VNRTRCQLHARLDEVRQVGEGLVYAAGAVEGEGRASGLEVSVPLLWLIEVSDGNAARLHSYLTEADALRVVGGRSGLKAFVRYSRRWSRWTI
jgi:hypothetical protein